MKFTFCSIEKDQPEEKGWKPFPWPRKDAEDIYNHYLEEMLSKYCPHIDSPCLGIKCVHFQENGVFMEAIGCYDYKMPECKLWRKHSEMEWR